MKILIIILFLIMGCQTTKQETVLTLEDGYTPKFSPNDCALLNMEFIKRNNLKSDRTPVKILYVSLKYAKYVVLIDHPKVEGIGAPVLAIKKFDDNWEKCPDELK